jgi:hypothetical protein
MTVQPAARQGVCKSYRLERRLAMTDPYQCPDCGGLFEGEPLEGDPWALPQDEVHREVCPACLVARLQQLRQHQRDLLRLMRRWP